MDHDRERDNGPCVNWDSYFVASRCPVASRDADIECGPGSWRLAAMRSTGYAFWDLYTSWCNCHWSPEEYAELFEKETPDEEDEGEDEGEYKGEGLSDEEYSETEDDDDDFAGEEAGVHEDIEEGGIAEDDKAQKATRSPERMSEV